MTDPKRRQLQLRGLVVLCDADGTILSVLRDDFGLASSGEAGTLAGLLHPSSVGKALSFLAEARRHRAALDWELVVTDGDRERSLYFVAGVTGDGILVAGTSAPNRADEFFDEFMHMNNEQVNALRTAMKERTSVERLYEDLSALNNDLTTLQRDLQKKNRELERLNEQKNQFIGMAAHDLRNPLSSFYSLCELLLSDLQEDHGNFRELLEEMKRSSRSMLGLVNDLLDISKIESGKLELRFEEVDLGWFLRRNLSINRALAERKHIALALDAPEEPINVTIDPGKIDQVLNNLISNAVKYSGEGDRILVAVHESVDEVEIEVTDHGPGIPAKEVDKLFKPFGRTSVRATGGETSTGLGLLICRKIVEGHRGTIWVESVEGEGSTFRFTVPRRAPEGGSTG